MHYTLTQAIGTTPPEYRRTPADDALAPIRGILIGSLLSVFGFWLPLALALAR